MLVQTVACCTVIVTGRTGVGVMFYTVDINCYSRTFKTYLIIAVQ